MSGGLQWVFDNQRMLSGYMFSESGKITFMTVAAFDYAESFSHIEPEYSLFETRAKAEKGYRIYLRRMIKTAQKEIAEQNRVIRRYSKLLSKL